MSATDVSTPAPAPNPAPAADGPAPPRVGTGVWARVAVACALLLGSAGVRAWQERRIEADLVAGRQRPRFDLRSLPLDLGRWKGSTTDIDAQIARATGADQIITRRYVNQDTGAAVDLIVLYGPAADVYLHAPEICYPAAGFSLAGGAEDRQVNAGSSPAPFRALVYSKGEGAQADLQEVYYSWWYNGRWNPNIGIQKQFERIPGMFKVHLARRTTPGEKRDVGNPCESLLNALLPEFERHLEAARTAAR